MKKLFFLSFGIYVLGVISACISEKYFLEIKSNSLSFDSNYYSNITSKELFLIILKNNTIIYFTGVLGFFTLGLMVVLNIFYNGFVMGYLISTINRHFEDSTLILHRILPHSMEILGILVSSTLGFYLTQYFIKKIFLKTEIIFELKSFVIFFILGYLLILTAAYIESYVSAK